MFDLNYKFIKIGASLLALGKSIYYLFKVRARAAKVIFVCCFSDPRASRGRDMFRYETFEV